MFRRTCSACDQVFQTALSFRQVPSNFNATTHPVLDMGSAQLLPATPENRAKVVKWIKKLEPDADTASEDALEKALRLQPQVIYFLTEGEIPPTTADTVKGLTELTRP
jgi:hypothetical protein